MLTQQRMFLIRQSVAQLSDSFGGVRKPVDTVQLLELFNTKRHTEMFREVKEILNLRMSLRIGYVNSGGPKSAPAWIDMPVYLPMYGTDSFKRTTITVYARKSFLRDSPFASLVTVMAHEMSHIVLHAIRHPLRESEAATDLCAMVLGFADIFEAGKREHEAIQGQEGGPLQDILGIMGILQEATRDGSRYLSGIEATYAAELIRGRSR